MKIQFVALILIVALCACSSKSESSNAASSAASAAASAAGAAASAAGAAATAAATAAAVAQNGAQASEGGKVYQTNCASCHQANGAGVAGVFPPLAKNPTVTGDPKQLIHIIKYGLNGKIQVAGQTYNGTMPNWAQQISNADIASAVTYIRSSWGNTASAVSETDVAGVSK